MTRRGNRGKVKSRTFPRFPQRLETRTKRGFPHLPSDGGCGYDKGQSRQPARIAGLFRFLLRTDFRTQRSRQPRSDLGNDFGRDALLSEGLKRLNDRAALPKLETRLLQGRVFEYEAGTADFVVSVRTIG